MTNKWVMLFLALSFLLTVFGSEIDPYPRTYGDGWNEVNNVDRVLEIGEYTAFTFPHLPGEVVVCKDSAYTCLSVTSTGELVQIDF